MTGPSASTRLTEPSGSPHGSRGAPPGAPPEGPPFQSALESEWARTASAEGHNDSSLASTVAPRPHRQAREAQALTSPQGMALAATTLTTAPGTSTEGAAGIDSTEEGTARGAPSSYSSLLDTADSASQPLTGESPETTASSLPASSSPTAIQTAGAASSIGATATTDSSGATDALAAEGTQTADSTKATSLAGAPEAASLAGAPQSAALAGAPQSAGLAGAPEAVGTPAAVNRPGTAGTAIDNGVSTVGGLLESHAMSVAAPASTQPAATVAGTPNPFPSPLTETSAQTPAPASGSAAAGEHARAATSKEGTSTPRASTAIAALRDTLLGIQPSGRESPTGDAALGEHRGGTRTDTANATSAAGETGTAHDTLWVPDSTLQVPGETASPAAASAPGAALTAAYDPAVADPTFAADGGALADLGGLDLGGGLAQAVEALQATIELAARQGVAQARIALHPAELGAIRIHLTQTAEGLLARVTADTRAAAQALATGHAELRQSLGQLGLGSVRLHIAHGGAAVQGEAGAATEGRPGGHRAGAHAAQAPSARGVGRSDSAVTADVAADIPTAVSTLTDTGRALDVLV